MSGADSMLDNTGERSLPPIPANDATAVAMLILAMNREDASKLLSKLDEDEIRTIVRRAAVLGKVSADQLEATINAFEAEIANSPQVSGSESAAQLLVQEALSDDIAERILSELNDSPIAGETWSEIPRLGARQVAEAIAAEHPQIRAYILSRIDPDFAALVISEFEIEARQDLFQRLLEAPMTQHRAARILEAHLTDTLLSQAVEGESTPIHVQAAGILNRLERPEVNSLIGGLSSYSPNDAKIIRRMIFSFDDTPKLNDEDRAKLFEVVPPEQLVLALNGASSDLVETALGCLTARSRRMIELELQSSKARPEKDVDDARRAIAQLAINLAQEGKIKLPSDENEEEEDEQEQQTDREVAE